jgi:hypothetical protein
MLSKIENGYFDIFYEADHSLVNKYLSEDGYLNLNSDEDPKLFPDGIVKRFLKGIEHRVNPRLNILRHFHDSIDEICINRLASFFKNCYGYFHICTQGNDPRFELECILFFNFRGETIEKRVLVDIGYDENYKECRIVEIRDTRNRKLLHSNKFQNIA